jgi:Ca2+/Na+ antiporter
MIATAIDVILVFVVVEGVALALYRRATGRGPVARKIPAMLAAGFFLMLAVRLALAGVSELWLAACFLAALVAHLLDLSGRWRD